MEESFIPNPPEKKPDYDDMSDLFNVSREEMLDTEDVVRVDMDEDIIDADEDGTLDSLVTVTNEDVMGDDLYGQSPLDTSDVQERKKRALLQRTRKPFYPLATPQIGGLNI